MKFCRQSPPLPRIRPKEAAEVVGGVIGGTYGRDRIYSAIPQPRYAREEFNSGIPYDFSRSRFTVTRRKGVFGGPASACRAGAISARVIALKWEWKLE
jgi:hypothetical protein